MSQQVCSKLPVTKGGWCVPLCVIGGWTYLAGGLLRAVYVLTVNALRLGCHPEYLWLLKEGQLSAQVPMERNVDGD